MKAMNRRSFLKRAGQASIAGAIVASGVAEVKAFATPERVEATAIATPTQLSEVLFVIDKQTIVNANIIGRHEDGRLDLDVVVHPDKAFASRTNFYRVRRATLNDLKPGRSVAGTWFVHDDVWQATTGGLHVSK